MEKNIHISVSAFALSDIGCRRKNEDTFLLGTKVSLPLDRSLASVSGENPESTPFLAGVFDGISTGGNGDRASQLAASVFEKLPRDGSLTEIDSAIHNGFQVANDKITHLRRTIGISGTTGTVLAVFRNACKVYHMGDSRAYLYRDGQIFQLTRDQTLAQMKADLGLYDENAPRAAQEKHMLTDYIGADNTLKRISPAESSWIPLRDGDRLLLCSDGLYGMCQSSQIREILNCYHDPESAASELVSAAKKQGGHDNITSVVIEIHEMESLEYAHTSS